MVFPDIVTSRFELWDGTAWVDITGDVYHRDGLVIERGRKNEASSVDPGRAAFTLNNRAGTYSPRNPLSSLYGVIGRNTPVRISVQGPDTYLRTEDIPGSRARATSSTALDISQDLDIRVELALDRFPSQYPLDVGSPYAEAQQEITGRWTPSTGLRSWRLFLGPDGQLELTWSPDGTSTTGVYSTDVVPFRSGERCAVRATLDTNNGAGGYDLTFYWADSLAGPWTRLGDVITGGSATAINNPSGVPLDIGDIEGLGFARGAGRYYALELRNGINGSVIANPDFTAQTPGATSFSDNAGRTWTVNAPAELTDYYTRFTGEISVWPQRWDVSGNDVWTPVEASGILRRLGQGSKPLDSTLRRRIPSVEPFPLAYWPMEEGKSAERIPSPVEGVKDLSFSGFTFDSNSDLAGSKPLPVLTAAASMSGRFTGATPGAWQAEYVYLLEEPPASGTPVMLRVDTTGNVWNRFDVETTNTAVRVMAYNTATDTSSLVINVTNPEFTGQFNRLQLFSWESGSNTMVTVRWITIGGGGLSSTHTYTGTAGAITRVSSPFGSELEGMAIGHLAVWDSNDVQSMNSADHGFNAERVLDRIQRLAHEEKLTLSAPGRASLTEQTGPQSITTALDIFQETADADAGTLFELRGVLGLQYEPRYRSYNPRYALELDYAANGEVAPPLEPVDDDQALRNDVTVTRDGGSSTRAVLESGPLSTNPPPAGVGVYDDAVTLNLATDAQTAELAGWRLHMGTWDEARYPVVSLDLRAAPHLAQTVLDHLDVTAFVRIVNPPAWLPPDPIRLRVEGYDESIAQDEWRIRLQCSPAGPWSIALTDDAVLGRADTDGSELGSGITDSATSMNVAITDGPLWTTDGTEFPFDVRVGGEVMTVTAISGSASPQTFTVVRSVNGVTKTHSTGTDVRLDQPATIPL